MKSAFSTKSATRIIGRQDIELLKRVSNFHRTASSDTGRHTRAGEKTRNESCSFIDVFPSSKKKKSPGIQVRQGVCKRAVYS